MSEVKIVAKTLRFKMVPGPLAEFVGKQKNFSASMRYLILEYLARRKASGLPVEDLALKLDEVSVSGMMDSIIKDTGMPQESQDVPWQRSAKNPSGQLGNVAKESTGDIPDCYI